MCEDKMDCQSYTEQELAHLPPEHELDVLVGERVMGWRYSIIYRSWVGRTSGESWQPSTSLVQACDVVRRLLERGWYLQLLWYEHAACAGFYDGNHEPELYVEAWGDTPELAICRASLIAIQAQ